MIQIKAGAQVNGIRPEILLALMVVNEVYANHGILCVITEGTGSKHGIGSLHYVGLAVDLRTRDMPGTLQVQVTDIIRERLGKQYDVVLEKDHIHIEFQPK